MCTEVCKFVPPTAFISLGQVGPHRCCCCLPARRIQNLEPKLDFNVREDNARDFSVHPQVMFCDYYASHYWQGMGHTSKDICTIRFCFRDRSSPSALDSHRPSHSNHLRLLIMPRSSRPVNISKDLPTPLALCHNPTEIFGRRHRMAREWL
jgi:hypothetical protein